MCNSMFCNGEWQKVKGFDGEIMWKCSGKGCPAHTKNDPFETKENGRRRY